jgi:hypothetical protein
MGRSAAISVIAVALAAYGIYMALYVPPLLVGPPVTLVLIGFLAQACAALAAAVGVWQGRSWAPAAVIVLGIAIAATQLVEGFVLGLIAYGRALIVALAALAITWIVALYVRRSPRAIV